jgi:hypothetical protein
MKNPNQDQKNPSKVIKNSTTFINQIDRKALQKSLQEAVQKSRKNQKELWCEEILKYHQLISDAFFSGAPKMEIHKVLVNLGFKIPQKAFLFYFEKKVSPKKSRNKKDPKLEDFLDENLKPKPSGFETGVVSNASNLSKDCVSTSNDKEDSFSGEKSNLQTEGRRSRKNRAFRIASDDL